MRAMICSLRACTLSHAAAVACCVAAFAPGMARGQTLTNYIWTGSTSTDFATPTNWTSGSVAPSGGSFSDSRITLGTGTTAPLNELVYSSAQGTTTYVNTGTTNQSGLFIGAFSGAVTGLSASMRITGGSFTSNTERADGVSSQGNGTLTIDGGAYTKTGANSDFGVKWQGDGTGTLNVESSSFTAGRIVYGAAGTGGAGVTNLTGGTTTVNQIVEVNATTSTLNLNGGTLRAGATESNFIAVDQALVSAGGAVIDTQGFAVTIAQRLIEDGASTGGGLTKFGSGTLTLSGSNTYTGGTQINAGSLALTGSGSLASTSAVNITASGATFDISGITATGLTIGSLSGSSGSVVTLGGKGLTVGGTSSTTFGGGIAGSGSLTKTGDGTLTLSGSNSYSGGTTINAGGLVVEANGGLGSGAAGTLLESTTSTAATLQLADGVTVSETLKMQRGSSGGVPFGVVILEGLADANAEWAGQVRLGNGGELVTSPLLARFGHLGNGTLTVSGQIVDDVNGSASNLGIQAQATGVVRISGTSNTYTGVTNVFRGVLQLGATDALPTATILDVHRNNGLNIAATFDMAGFSQTIGGLQSSAGAGSAAASIRNTGGTLSTLTVNQAANSTFDGTIIEQVTLVKEGAGTLTLSGSNTYTGGTQINAGFLALTGSGSLASTSAVNITASGAAFDISGITATGLTIGSLSGSSGSVVTLGGKGLAVGGTSSTTFGGGFTGTGSLTKLGTGTLTLSGSSSYSGSTTLNGGNLVVGANAALGSAAGGTLLQSTGSNAASLQLANGVTVSETLTIIRGGTSTAPLGLVAVEGLADANAEWAGQVRLGNGGELVTSPLLARFGHLGNGTLTVSGQIVDNVNGSASNLGIQAQATGVVRISGTSNTYTGVTNVFRGVLQLGATDALPTATILDVNRNGTAGIDATFDLAGFSQTIGRLQSTSFFGATTARIRNTGGTLSTLTVNQAANSTFAGTILDQVALVKQGAGTLTLSAADNAYTGGTVVSGGTLALAATGRLLGAGTIDIAAAGTFDVTALAAFEVGAGQAIGGGGTVLGSLFFNADSDLVFSTTDTLTLTGGTASFFAGTPGSRFGIDNLLGISASTPLGTYTLMAGSVNVANLDNVGLENARALGGGVSAYFQEGSLQVVVVPEPGAVGLAAAAALALVGLGAARRKRQ